MIILLTSCDFNKDDLIYTKTEVTFIEVIDYSKKVLLFKDNNKLVTIKYSRSLFEMEWLEIIRLTGNPVFVFYKDQNGYYYRT